MVERISRSIPDWAKHERAGDFAWIAENLPVFWPVAHAGYQTSGRGAVVVDTTSRPTGTGHPFLYLPEVLIVRLADLAALRLVRAYDPTWEFVVSLWKTQDRVSTYRMGVPSQKQ
ncbi:MAG: hypothetical protein HY782_02245 [Chloroflexi bacterium]|nr:hypothetical protein [Chloroflexota bacterium]